MAIATVDLKTSKETAEHDMWGNICEGWCLYSLQELIGANHGPRLKMKVYTHAILIYAK